MNSISATQTQASNHDKDQQSQGINWRKWLLIDVFLAFTVYSIYVLYQDGYIGLFQYGLANISTIQITVDLVIACCLGIGCIIVDARRNNRKALPFIGITLFLGSIGLLAYAIYREIDIERQG